MELASERQGGLCQGKLRCHVPGAPTSAKATAPAATASSAVNLLCHSSSPSPATRFAALKFLGVCRVPILIFTGWILFIASTSQGRAKPSLFRIVVVP